MRLEGERVVDLSQNAVPGGMVGGQAKVLRIEVGEMRWAHSKSPFEHADLIPVEAHKSRRGAVDSERVGSGEKDAARVGVGGHRSIAFPPDDPIHDSEVTARRRAGAACTVETEQAFIEIEHHAPAGIVPVPIAGPYDLLGVAKEHSSGLLEGDKETGERRTVLEQPFGGAHPGVFEAGFGGVSGELIPPLRWRAFGMVREPVLIGVDSHQVLQRTRQTNFFVGLEFRQIDEDVGLHWGTAKKVFVVGTLMAAVGFGHVIAGSIQPAAAGKPHEFTGGVEGHLGAPQRIARQDGFAHGDTVDGVPFLGTQVQEIDGEARELAAAGVDDVVEPAVFPQGGKRGIRLGCIADDEGSSALELGGDPADGGLNDRRVGDDVFPGIGTGVAFVVFLDPVGFEHDPIPWADEVGRKVKPSQGVLDAVENGGRSAVIGLPSNRGDEGAGRHVAQGSGSIAAG